MIEEWSPDSSFTDWTFNGVKIWAMDQKQEKALCLGERLHKLCNLSKAWEGNHGYEKEHEQLRCEFKDLQLKKDNFSIYESVNLFFHF